MYDNGFEVMKKNSFCFEAHNEIFVSSVILCLKSALRYTSKTNKQTKTTLKEIQLGVVNETYDKISRL